MERAKVAMASRLGLSPGERGQDRELSGQKHSLQPTFSETGWLMVASQSATVQRAGMDGKGQAKTYKPGQYQNHSEGHQKLNSSWPGVAHAFNPSTQRSSSR